VNLVASTLINGALASLARRRVISVLPQPGGADHQAVLGRNFLAQFGGKPLAAPAVAQGNGDGALGILLSNYMLVQ